MQSYLRDNVGNNLEGLRNVGQGVGESKKPLVAELDYRRINVTSTRLRESVTAMIVEDKPISDLKTKNNTHFSNDSS